MHVVRMTHKKLLLSHKKLYEMRLNSYYVRLAPQSLRAAVEEQHDVEWPRWVKIKESSFWLKVVKNTIRPWLIANIFAKDRHTNRS